MYASLTFWVPAFLAVTLRIYDRGRAVRLTDFLLMLVTGGLSGRCVHPVAVKCVYDAHRFSKLPILAMGGVYGWQDAVELMLAGATAVAVGTATFTAPETAAAVTDGIAAYCEENGFKSVRELTGALAH